MTHVGGCAAGWAAASAGGALSIRRQAAQVAEAQEMTKALRGGSRTAVVCTMVGAEVLQIVRKKFIVLPNPDAVYLWGG